MQYDEYRARMEELKRRRPIPFGGGGGTISDQPKEREAMNEATISQERARRLAIITTPTTPPDAHAELHAADRALDALHRAASAMHDAVDAQFGPLIDSARHRKLRGFAMVETMESEKRP